MGERLANAALLARRTSWAASSGSLSIRRGDLVDPVFGVAEHLDGADGGGGQGRQVQLVGLQIAQHQALDLRGQLGLRQRLAAGAPRGAGAGGRRDLARRCRRRTWFGGPRLLVGHGLDLSIRGLPAAWRGAYDEVDVPPPGGSVLPTGDVRRGRVARSPSWRWAARCVGPRPRSPATPGNRRCPPPPAAGCLQEAAGRRSATSSSGLRRGRAGCGGAVRGGGAETGGRGQPRRRHPGRPPSGRRRPGRPRPAKPVTWKAVQTGDAVLVTVEVTPRSARLLLDGGPMPSNPARLDKGTSHTITAMAPGFETGHGGGGRQGSDHHPPAAEAGPLRLAAASCSRRRSRRPFPTPCPVPMPSGYQQAWRMVMPFSSTQVTHTCPSGLRSSLQRESGAGAGAVPASASGSSSPGG